MEADWGGDEVLGGGGGGGGARDGAKVVKMVGVAYQSRV